MSWFVFALIAAFLWSLVNLIDKHVIDKELKDPILCSTVYSFMVFIIFFFSSLAFGLPSFSWQAFLAGLLFSLAIYCYYKALTSGEVSRVIPLTYLNVLLVLGIAVVFLGEPLTLLDILGIFLLVAGAGMITMKKDRAGKVSLLAALSAAVLFGLRNILVKVSFLSFFSGLFSLSLGTLSFGLVSLLLHHPHLRRKMKRGIEHLLLSSGLSALGFFSFVYSVFIGMVSLATALVSVQSLFVFMLAVFLSKTHPKILKEELRGSMLEIKLISILLILSGIFLIS